MNQSLNLIEWPQANLHPFQTGVDKSVTGHLYLILWLVVGALLILYIMYKLHKNKEENLSLG